MHRRTATQRQQRTHVQTAIHLQNRGNNVTPSSQKKTWYSKLTVENITKYLVLAGIITGMLTTVGRIVAVPYIKGQIDTAITVNNHWLEQQYAGKNELLIKIYESQKETRTEIGQIKEEVANIKGKLSK